MKNIYKNKYRDYPLPHLARPILPAEWHKAVGQCLLDLCAISSIFDVQIRTEIREEKDGGLFFNALTPRVTRSDAGKLVHIITARCQVVAHCMCEKCGNYLQFSAICANQNCIEEKFSGKKIINKSENWLLLSRPGAFARLTE
jgi:hypothetical protein